MSSADYPYVAKDQVCAHDDSKIIGRTKEWGTDGYMDVQKMKERLQRQPGTVHVAASAMKFRLYRSGTLK